MNNSLKFIVYFLSFIGACSLIILLWEVAFEDIISGSPNGDEVVIDDDRNQKIQRFSSGNHLLFENQTNPNAEEGVKAFNRENYNEAYQQFRKAVNNAPGDPEVQIYLNNSQARKSGNPFILAAVVPVDANKDNAEEMLRGVAQAQTQFNRQGINGRLLEIRIFNDSNNKDYAREVAKEIINSDYILGVIGHNSSGASSEGLKEYERAGMAMISPTSTSTDLSGNSFFRTVPSDAKAGQFLARYAIENKIRNVAILYTSTSNYSKSLKDAFVNGFKSLGDDIEVVDMSESDFNPKNTVEELKNQVDGFVLFPNTNKKILDLSLQVADANANLANPKKLLGGDALYKLSTLASSKGGVRGLVLAVPWFAKSTYSYANLAEKRWRGRVSWRTATSYDATKAFIEALSDDATRKSVLTNLEKTSLPSSETSGERLRFFINNEDGNSVLKNGDRDTKPLLVRVIPQINKYAEYDFEVIED
ncbi:ABC transporter substrate-binding protein [Crocosphaera sp. Alani8]|uniref:ABC transporter substrate-binding protein n=1 Tax=Crocosphaera sp. Alani8 TaxID=3038952 RepID=UPI00313DB388